VQEEEIQKAIFVGNYDGAVDTCLKAGRLADALLIANIGGAELFKKTMQRYMRRNPRPYMAVGTCSTSLTLAASVFSAAVALGPRWCSSCRGAQADETVVAGIKYHTSKHSSLCCA
jgi:hypothetical protein